MDYRSLPVSLVATLVAGLRENSRIRMKENDVNASQDTIFLATIVDRLGAIAAWAMGIDKPEPITEELLGSRYKRTSSDNKENVMAFESSEDFQEARYGEKKWPR